MSDPQNVQYVKLPDNSYAMVDANTPKEKIAAMVASKFPKEFAAAKAGSLSPQMQMNRALNASPTQFEIARNPSFQEGIGASFLHTLGAMGKGLAKIPEMATPLGAAQNATDIATQNQQREAMGRSLPYRALATGTSAIGMNPTGMEQAADVGNKNAIYGQAGAMAAPALVGAEVGRQLKTSTAGPPPEIQKQMAVESITNAVNPAAKDMPGFRANLNPNLDFAKSYAETKGMPVGNRGQLASAMQGAGKEMGDYFRENYIKPTANVELNAPRGYSGDTVTGTSVVEPRVTVQQLYNRLGTINDTLYPKYQKGSGTAVSASLGAENTAALNAEAANIRQTLYKTIGDKLGIDPKAVAETNARSGSMRRQAEEIQLSADREQHGFNESQQQPWTLDTTMVGAAGRLLQGRIRSVVGNPADRAIASVFRKYSGGDVTRPAGNPLDFPGAPQPRMSGWQGAETQPTQPPSIVSAIPSEAAQSAQRGSLTYRANVNAMRLREALMHEQFNAANSRSALSQGKWGK